MNITGGLADALARSICALSCSLMLAMTPPRVRRPEASSNRAHRDASSDVACRPCDGADSVLPSDGASLDRERHRSHGRTVGIWLRPDGLSPRVLRAASTSLADSTCLWGALGPTRPDGGRARVRPTTSR